MSPQPGTPDPETEPTVPTVEADRLGRNFRHLALSGVVTAVMGFVYWWAAERLFHTAEVGRANVAVTTATMLGTLSCVSLGGMYERFLTPSGHRARSMIAAGCGIVLGAALVVGSGFALLDPSDLFTDTAERLWYPVIVAAFAVFALADPILVGLRDAGIVAVKNITHAIAKLAVLPLAVLVTGSAWVIYGSWALFCGVAAVLALFWAWRRSTLPLLDQPARLPQARSLVTHHAAVFSMMVVSLVLPLYLPLVVLHETDSTHAAWFGVAQVLVSGSTLFLAAVHSSYVAEASHHGTDTATVTRRMARLSGLLALGCAAVLGLAGPPLLWIVGHDYQKHATGHLVLMAISIIPQAVVGAYAVMARVRNRLRLALAVQIATVVLVVSLAPWAVREWGLTGVGAVFLTTESAAALIVLVPLIGSWRVLTRRTEP